MLGASPASHSRYSTLPAGPGSGLATTPRTPSDNRAPAAATSRTAHACAVTSRTTPPGPRPSRPTSNCGLTRTTKSASGRAQARSAGSTSRSEMNDRSATTRSTSPPISSGARWRTLVRSSTRTRRSLRNRHANWPYPTSTATTSAARWRSNTSVKPPVDAPASRQRRPVTRNGGSFPAKVDRAASSLWAPREAYPGSLPEMITIDVVSSTIVAGLVAGRPLTRTRPPMIASLACSRERTRPRRTSSRSSRVLRTMAARLVPVTPAAGQAWRLDQAERSRARPDP